MTTADHARIDSMRAIPRKRGSRGLVGLLLLGLIAALLAVPAPAQAHRSPGYHQDGGSAVADRLNWMAALPDDRRLLELSVPGTHDTMAIHGAGGFTAWGWTQVMTLEEQLESGIRAIDIRLKYEDSDEDACDTAKSDCKFLLYHDTVRLEEYTFREDVMNVVDRFLDAHPSESVLMRVKNENDDATAAQKDLFRTELATAFAAYPRVMGATCRQELIVLQSDPASACDMRGRIVVMREYFGSSSDAPISLYENINDQNDYEVPFVWDLYDKWVAIKTHFGTAGSTTAAISDDLFLNWLSGVGGGSFAYFVASGHSSEGTGAPRLATGRTTPLWADSYPDFPRTGCLLGICTISYEGTNILAMNYLRDAVEPGGTLARGGRVGLVYADFPGSGLIEAIINVNEVREALRARGRIVAVTVVEETADGPGDDEVYLEWDGRRSAIQQMSTEPDEDKGELQTWRPDFEVKSRSPDGTSVSVMEYDPLDEDELIGEIFLPSPPYALPGTHFHTATLTGDSSVYKVTYATFGNVPPSAAIDVPITVTEGGSVGIHSSAQDMNNDPDGGLLYFDQPLTEAWDLDNDGAFDDATGQCCPTFSAADRDGPDTQIIRLQVNDGIADSVPESATVRIVNVAPDVSIASSVLFGDDPTGDVTAVQEGQSVRVDGTFSDPGMADSHVVTIDWGEGSPETLRPPVGTRTFTFTHRYVDDDPTGTPVDRYPVSVSVIDDDMSVSHADAVASGSTLSYVASVDVLVQNVAPTIDAGPDQVVIEEDLISLEPATFTDLGTADTHLATVDWGDGNGAQPATVTADAGPVDAAIGASGSLDASHEYQVPGVYQATVCITDDDDVESPVCDVVEVTVIRASFEIDPVPLFGPAAVNPFDDLGDVLSPLGGAGLVSDTFSFDQGEPADTAARIFQALTADNQFAQAGGTVLLASATTFADALASGPLQFTAPLLLTDPDRLSTVTADALRQNRPGQIVILGGTAAVSQGVEDGLRADEFTVTRLAGSTRLETAAVIADVAPGGPTDVLLARAYAGSESGDPTAAFADSIAAGAWAAEQGWPILLTETGQLSQTTTEWITAHDVQRVHVIGGTAAIDDAVLAQLRDLGVAVDRVSGDTRFSTAVAVSRARGLPADGRTRAAVVVEGTGPQAWAGGFASARVAAVLAAPLVLATPDGLPDTSQAHLVEIGRVLPTAAEVAPNPLLVCVVQAQPCLDSRSALGLPDLFTITTAVADGHMSGTVRPAAEGLTVVVDGTCLEGPVRLQVNAADGTFSVPLAPTGDASRCSSLVRVDIGHDVVQQVSLP